MGEGVHAGRARILIVDDHPIVRIGVGHRLREEPDLEVSGETPGTAEALALLEGGAPVDLVLSEVVFRHGPDGIECIKEIRSRFERIPVLVYSAQDEEMYAERCLHAGARGFLMKHESPDRLVDAIRRVLSGKVYLSDAMAERLLARHVEGVEDADRPAVDSLSDRELQVFTLLGRGRTTRRIAEELNLSVKTIETHRENIKEKLGVKHTNELIRRAVEWLLENR